MKKLILVAIAAILFLTTPIFAQDVCGVYLYVSTQYDGSTASVTVGASTDCYHPATYAEAHVNLPDGSHNDQSSNGSSYAQATAQISTTGKTGYGQFSGYGEASDTCWADSGDWNSFSSSFRLNDVTPNIAGVDPPSWNAGTNFTAHIYGSGFGANPAVSISDPNGTIITGQSTPTSNGQVDIPVTISPSAPLENATITVTSRGYNGQGFTSTQGNGPASPNFSVLVNPIPTVAMTVKEVSFSGNGKIDIYKDQVGSANLIANPVWKSSNSSDQNDPVAYVRTSTMQATVKFTITNPPSTAVPSITIEGVVSGFGKFRKTGVTIPVSASEITVSGITADTALPNTTKFYNPMTITWRHMNDGDSCPGSSCMQDGNTATKIYVTLATPLQQKVYETTLNLAVSNDGASDQTTAFQKTWTKFVGPANVNSWDNRPLYYYKNGVAFNGCALDEQSLLTSSSGSGQCGSWANLLISALGTNGISADFVTITANDATEFLVKSWTFNQETGAPPDPGMSDYKWRIIFNQTAINSGDVMVPTQPGDTYGDLTSNSTLPGQNSSPPSEKIFARHFIVKVNLSGVSPSYYDPSYGVTYTDANDFENKAVDGYMKQASGDPSNIFRVRQSAGLNNISFDK